MGLFSRTRVNDPYNTMGKTRASKAAPDPLTGVKRSPTGIRLTREAHARYERAVARAVQAYDEGNRAAHERASNEAADILDNPKFWA